MKRSIHAALPSIDSLVIFEHAADGLSFTKAGQRLGLTQSAVSRQVIDLEALLQVKLFARERQRLKLTNQGAEFRELIRPVIQDLRAATLRMQMGGDVQSNVLNISVAASFCNLWFIPNLPAYYSRQGEVRVNVMPHVGSVNFDSTSIDAAIVNAVQPPTNCEWFKLCDVDVAPYAAPSLLRRLGQSSLEGFERIPAVELKEMNGTWPKYLAHVGMGATGIDYVGGNHSLLLLTYEAAAAGLGAALLPPEFVPAGDQRGSLRRLHDKLLHTDRSYYYCWPSASRKLEAVQSLGSWLKREVGAARERGNRTAAS